MKLPRSTVGTATLATLLLCSVATSAEAARPGRLTATPRDPVRGSAVAVRATGCVGPVAFLHDHYNLTHTYSAGHRGLTTIRMTRHGNILRGTLHVPSAAVVGPALLVMPCHDEGRNLVESMTVRR